MAFLVSSITYLIPFSLLFGLCFSSEMVANFELELSYITVSPLGVPQQVIAVNGSFPGPKLIVTTNYVVTVNVKNNLDENLLITWPGLRMRRGFWQDGVLGTNCPIPPKQNWTYRFQAKDQIGSFFYFPSLNLQRAAGGFGPFIINSNLTLVPLPFNTPDGDIIIMMGDWYIQNHTVLRKALDTGNDLRIPDGVLINGKGPYNMGNGTDYETINVDPGKTYRIRVHNVGVSTCLNFRIENHDLLLVEIEGHYTTRQRNTSLDIHVGQSYSFLVTMSQNASKDYYIVASPKFVNPNYQYKNVTGVAILKYSNSKGKATGPLPPDPFPFNGVYNTYLLMNQSMSIRLDKDATGPGISPQGSFNHSAINVTEVYVLTSTKPEMINGTLRATLNGVSFKNPDYPIRLADLFNKSRDAYDLDFPTKPQLMGPPRISTSLINATYKSFIELVLQNNDTVVQSFHMDGYSFFVVGMAYGKWTEKSNATYITENAMPRSTIQAFPGAWTAIRVLLDNTGVWNIRTENLDRWYLGQETYIRVVDPAEDNTTVFNNVPKDVLYCGAIVNFTRPEKTTSSVSIVSTAQSKLYLMLLMGFSAVISILC